MFGRISPIRSKAASGSLHFRLSIGALLLALATGLILGCATPIAPAPAPAPTTATSVEPTPAAAVDPTEKLDFQGETLATVDFGGTFTPVWDEFVNKPFEEKYNAKIVKVQGLSYDILAKMQAQQEDPPVDVWQMSDAAAIVAFNQGLTEPLVPENIPALSQLFPEAIKPDNAYALRSSTSLYLAYNSDLVKTPPTSWNDLANPEYKGKILLPDLNSAAGIPFLIKMAQLNGGSEDNIEPGFAKIEELAPNALTFWTSHDQVANALTSGEAVMAVWLSDRVAALNQQGPTPITGVWPEAEGSIIIPTGIGISKNTKHKELAELYVNFALDKAQMKPVGEAFGSFPMNAEVELSPSTSRFVPSADVIAKSPVPDWDKITANQSKWTEEWAKRITGK